MGPGAGVQACPAGGATSSAACLLESALSNNITAGGKSGYTVDAVGVVVAPATTNVTYGVGSAPLVFNQTGVRRFCSEEDGVLHFDPNVAGVTVRTTTGHSGLRCGPTGSDG
jgi:hypothetical protein